jgi:hypothetical protein
MTQISERVSLRNHIGSNSQRSRSGRPRVDRGGSRGRTVDRAEGSLRRLVETPWQGIGDVGRLVQPAVLFAGRQEDVPQGRPEAERGGSSLQWETSGRARQSLTSDELRHFQQ